ncbi:MAG: carbamate kinase [Bacteroidota bacterium]
MKNKKLAVLALGGNALLRDNQAGTIDEQEENTFQTLENLVYLIKDGYNIVITHGNGPQVGNSLLRNDAGEILYQIPQMPLDICVADTQGGIGYMIERMFRNVLKKHGIEKDVVTLVTLVEVDQHDHAFHVPTKRIGKSYSPEMAEKMTNEKGWSFKEEAKSTLGYRRVVPSPKPLKIMNESLIKELALSGKVVIASGGGGIPVYYDESGDVRPAEAVIDKDLASSLLAADIGADEFYILTDVPYIYLDYKKETQRIAEFLDYADTLKYLHDGQFGEGNMAPKIRAALNFIENGGKKKCHYRSN